MANKMLFPDASQRSLKTDTVNEAGGTAYRLSAKHALAQYAVTGCLNGTYYAGAETQLEQVIELCARVEPEFIARTAVWCRHHGGMKERMRRSWKTPPGWRPSVAEGPIAARRCTG